MEKSSQSKHGGKALTSFDVNASDQFLAAGTEQASISHKIPNHNEHEFN